MVYARLACPSCGKDLKILAKKGSYSRRQCEYDHIYYTRKKQHILSFVTEVEYSIAADLKIKVNRGPKAMPKKVWLGEPVIKRRGRPPKSKPELAGLDKEPPIEHVVVNGKLDPTDKTFDIERTVTGVIYRMKG